MASWSDGFRTPPLPFQRGGGVHVLRLWSRVRTQSLGAALSIASVMTDRMKSAKEKGRGAAAFLWRWMVLARSTPKGGGLGGKCPRGTLRKHRSEGYPAFTLFQSCFVEEEMVSSRGGNSGTVVSAQHSQ